MNNEVVCAGCFARVGADRADCPDCGAVLWVGGRLRLVEPAADGRMRRFRGELRGDDGRMQEVAVSVLEMGGLSDWRVYERFRGQSEILASLSHRRIPRALGTFEISGRVLHCQTLVAGRTLAQHLRGASLTTAEATRLAEDLLELLEHVHEHGVVHRDLTPDSVIIDGDRRAHLIDFSAAGRSGKRGGPEPEPEVVGTPGYMAPEQARGESLPQSDLYALGRLLLEAITVGQLDEALAALTARLTKEDWRRRPASAQDAQRILGVHRPRLSRPWVAIAGSVLFTVAASAGIYLVAPGTRRAPLPPPPHLVEVAPGPRPAPAPAPLDEQARVLLRQWLDAQNNHDFEAYSRCYAPRFSGQRRTPNGKVLSLDRAAWLADRARIYAAPVVVEAAGVSVFAYDGKVSVSFVQRFRRGDYADHGDKKLDLEMVGGRLQITWEYMISSERGWDDADVPDVPGKVASCAAAFDPSGRKYLVSLSRHADHAGALRAAAKARRRKLPAEIVSAAAFADEGRGFLVLAGATDDEAEAGALAARVKGKVITPVLAPQPDPSTVRFLAKQEISGWSDSEKNVTVVQGNAYVIGYDSIRVFSTLNPDLREVTPIRLPPAVKAVRLAEHGGAPHLLDKEGYWHRIRAGGVERVPSFDPDAGEGTRAEFPSALAFKAGDDRMVLVRDGALYLFEVGQWAPRLTKVCGVVKSEDGFHAPAWITLGPLELVTDQAGGLEVWTGLRGFFKPGIQNLTAVLACSSPETEDLRVGELALFRQTSVPIQVTAFCINEAEGD